MTTCHPVQIDQKWIDLGGSTMTCPNDHVPPCPNQSKVDRPKWHRSWHMSQSSIAALSESTIAGPTKPGPDRVLATTIEKKTHLYLSIHPSYIKANQTSHYNNTLVHQSCPYGNSDLRSFILASSPRRHCSTFQYTRVMSLFTSKKISPLLRVSYVMEHVDHPQAPL